MTQSGNGHESEVKPEDLTVYEPAFIPETEENVGWHRTDTKGEEGELIIDLPPELNDEEESPN